MDRAEAQRQRHVCVTAKQEWLICDSICLGVRDRDTGAWLEDHYAVDERVQMVPRHDRRVGVLRWDLQVLTFGTTLRAGPVLEVRAAGDDLVLALPGHAGARHRALTGFEAPGPRQPVFAARR